MYNYGLVVHASSYHKFPIRSSSELVSHNYLEVRVEEAYEVRSQLFLRRPVKIEPEATLEQSHEESKDQ